LSDELKRKVTVEELMLETGMSRNKIMEAIRFSGNNIEYIEVEE
jgi:RNA polymerase primary sigma factor